MDNDAHVSDSLHFMDMQIPIFKPGYMLRGRTFCLMFAAIVGLAPFVLLYCTQWFKSQIPY
eukprot:6181046-Pleurochrysis_carterae.AAC.2